MDKKDKKRIEVLKQKMATLQKQIAGSKKQMDDPEELRRYETELEAVKKELATLQVK
ncbi:MAG: hypothetical protein ABL888_10355 [Pirellulaceae bacterium]|jgi:hypothetical protein